MKDFNNTKGMTPAQAVMAYKRVCESILADEEKIANTKDFSKAWESLKDVFFLPTEEDEEVDNLWDIVGNVNIQLKVGSMVFRSLWHPATVSAVDAFLKEIQNCGYKPYEYNVADDESAIAE